MRFTTTIVSADQHYQSTCDWWGSSAEAMEYAITIAKAMEVDNDGAVQIHVVEAEKN